MRLFLLVLSAFVFSVSTAVAKPVSKPAKSTAKSAVEVVREAKEDDVPVLSVSTEKPQASGASAFQQALAMAYENHPQILAERKAYEGQAEEIAKAVGEFLPRFGLGYDKTKNTYGLDSRPDFDANSDTKYAYVEQPIFEGGGSLARLAAAKHYTKAAAYFLEQREQEILLQAATAYMDLYLAAQMVELNQKNTKVLKEQLRIAKERFDVGELTRTDTSQAEARLATAQASAEQADGQLLRAKASYQRVFNQPAPAVPQIPDVNVKLPESLDVFLEQSAQSHPIFLRSKALKDAAASDENSELAKLLPTVFFTGQASREKGEGLFASRRFDNDALKLSVRIPLYQGGAEYAAIRQREKNSEQRKYEVMDAEHFARENAIQSWEQWQTAQAMQISAGLASKAAEIALDGVKQEHELGTRTVLDVLDAERESFQSQLLLQQSGRDSIVARFAVLAAAGALTPQSLGLQVEQYDSAAKAQSAYTHIIGF